MENIAHLYLLDEFLKVLFVVSDIELLDHDVVGMLVMELHQVVGIVGISVLFRHRTLLTSFLNNVFMFEFIN